MALNKEVLDMTFKTLFTKGKKKNKTDNLKFTKNEIFFPVKAHIKRIKRKAIDGKYIWNHAYEKIPTISNKRFSNIESIY